MKYVQQKNNIKKIQIQGQNIYRHNRGQMIDYQNIIKM